MWHSGGRRAWSLEAQREAMEAAGAMFGLWWTPGEDRANIVRAIGRKSWQVLNNPLSLSSRAPFTFSLNSLTTFRTQVHFRSTSGGNGTGSQMHGADAEDLLIHVPPGTIIRRKEAQEAEAPLAELVRPGDKALLIVGGRGGRGNESFKTARNTAPTLAERGEAGVEAWVDLELKVVADVGIIGIPNAGKSTLLSVVTSARPKIANYPFTTLVPNLGVCEMDYRTTVFAGGSDNLRQWYDM